VFRHNSEVWNDKVVSLKINRQVRLPPDVSGGKREASGPTRVRCTRPREDIGMEGLSEAKGTWPSSIC
jgi:hypothetical protein